MRAPARFIITNVLALALAGSAFAADPPAPKGHGARASASSDEPAASDTGTGEHADARALDAAEAKITPADYVSAPINEVSRTTHHTTVIGGRSISYEATAGTLTLRDDDGRPTASMFYVAYVADHGKGAPTRPITFMFNGGPGSSSMWLHMGSLGPVRVQTDQPQPSRGAPYHLVPNDNSLLDRSDLVFIDAIGTGLSRPLGDTKGEKFWGVDQDIDAFARGITRYVNMNNRWNSPKFIFGESYGTPRASGLVYALQQQGMQINGVVLLSSILNFGTREAGYDQNLINFLPSYAAAAWYHNRVPNRPADLAAFVQQARDFARGPYALALGKGDSISPEELDQTAQKMSYFTGLSPAFLKRSDLRVDLGRFRAELLRDQGEIIGRLDSRFTGTEPDAANESASYDPADVQVGGPYVGLLNDYLRGELGYQTKLTYRPNYYSAIGPAWDWRHRPPGSRRQSAVADMALDLGEAMRENPHLKVLSLNGYYDFATPFGGTEYDLNHMQINKTLQQNLHYEYYPSGHMVYLNPDALKVMKRDLVSFYDEAAPGTE
ncbi:MAG: peptidase S10 [Caulobacteraceae bacterium]